MMMSVQVQSLLGGLAGWRAKEESWLKSVGSVVRGILFGERGQCSKKFSILEPMRLCVIGSNLPFSESVLLAVCPS